MNWLLKLLGIQSKEDKMRKDMKHYLQKVFEMQRKGDLEKAGFYQKKADAIADELTNTDTPEI